MALIGFSRSRLIKSEPNNERDQLECPRPKAEGTAPKGRVGAYVALHVANLYPARPN